MLNVEDYDFGESIVTKQTFLDNNKYFCEYGENIILLTQVGSFYEMYGLKLEDEDNDENIIGSNIVIFSKITDLEIVEKSNMKVKNIKNGKKYLVMMAGFKDTQLEKKINRLQNDIYTVVVISQKVMGIANPERYVTGIYSPGTSFSEKSVQYENELNNVSMCFWVENTKTKTDIGVSCFNIYTGESNIYEYSTKFENNPLPFVDLEKFVSCFKPSETIIISNLDPQQIDKILLYSGIKSKIVHRVNYNDSIKAKNCEKQNYQKEILSKFYKYDDYSTFFANFRENIIATQSFCYLLDFLIEHDKNIVEKIPEPSFYNVGTKVLLKNYTLRQLDILDDGLRKGKKSSVLRFLNECVTSNGKRYFNDILLNPIFDEIELNREYNIIEYLISLTVQHRNKITDMLKNICDIQKLIRYVCLKKVNPKNLWLIWNVLMNAKKIYIESEQFPDLKKYMNEKGCNLNVEELEEFIECIEYNFIIANCKSETGYHSFKENIVNVEVSKELKMMSDLENESENKLNAIVNYLNSLIGNEFVSIYITEKTSIGLKCTSKRCELFKSKMDGKSVELSCPYGKFNFSNNFTFEKQSGTNNYIVNSEINRLCDNLSNCKQNLSKKNDEIYNKLISKLYTFQNILKNVSFFITIIDFIYCKTNLAIKYNYCKPVIQASDNSFFSFSSLRHPLIEIINVDDFYISNDINLNGNGILLYGCNTSGKSSIIKSIGVNLILAQAGFYVAASEMTYYPYRKIFPRLVNSDNLFEGLSSFIVEMLELKTIIDMADKYSLVLGNECLSTTDEASATGLIIAIFEQISKTNSSFIFATHMHKLPHYSEIMNLTKDKKIVIKHLTVFYEKLKNKLIYTRKLEDGPGSDCYGNEVCKSMNLNDEFLNRAIEITNKYYPSSESILSQEVTKYNKEKIKTKKCEKCGLRNGEEMHHIIHQEDADKNGFVKDNNGLVYHKNHKKNLIFLCGECHKLEHK